MATKLKIEKRGDEILKKSSLSQSQPNFAEMILGWSQRLPGACNRSHGSKLLSITTQLHCGGHLGGRVQLPHTILEEDNKCKWYYQNIFSVFMTSCSVSRFTAWDASIVCPLLFLSFDHLI
jgi:hypothetical protein